MLRIMRPMPLALTGADARYARPSQYSTLVTPQPHPDHTRRTCAVPDALCRAPLRISRTLPE